MSQVDNSNNFPTMWFSKSEFTTLMGLYAQSISCNIFKDYSLEYSPSASWQRFHFKKHSDADSDIYIQVERYQGKKLYSCYDNLNGIKKRSSSFNTILSNLRKGIYKRAPAIKRSLFSEDKNSAFLHVIDK